jgi:hypothetical protein
MINPYRFNLALQPIPDADQRITRIVAEHSRTGEVTTAGILFTGDRHAHDDVQTELLQLADSFDLAGGHWHRQSETDGSPTFCNEPDPDGEGAWLKFAADYGIPPEEAPTTLLGSQADSESPNRSAA